MSTERLNQSSDRIRESRRAALETEELGVSILEDLHQQRETLLHSHNKACLTTCDFVITSSLTRPPDYLKPLFYNRCSRE